MGAIKRAKASGDTAEVERLKWEFTSRLTARAASARRAARGIASSGEVSDPLDRLEKLADLHKGGVLSDAEFAIERTKILDDGSGVQESGRGLPGSPNALAIQA